MHQCGLVLFLRQVLKLLLSSCGLTLNHDLVQFELDPLPLNNLFLDGVFCDQAVDKDFFLLTDPVAAIHSLQVDLRVKVRVINDHVVRGDQVDAQAASSGRNDEDQLGGAWPCEILNLGLSFL